MATLPIDSNVDLLKNELQNFKIHNLSTAPNTTGWSGINYGYAYYNTSNLTLWIWNGTAFQSAGGAYVHPNHTGDVTSVADGATTIAADAVTNTKLANMAASTLKGNNTGATADPADLTAAQVRTLLNVADGAQANVSTNLALGTTTTTTQPVTNSNGTGFTLASATTSLAGLMSSGDKVKIDAAILTSTTDVSAASWVDTSTALGALNTKVPTQNAVKTYVDNLVLTNGSLVYKGGYDAAGNSPLLDATPIAGIKKGWTYVVTVAGTFFTAEVEPGDMIIALQDTPTLEAHWTVVNKNIPSGVATKTSTTFGNGVATSYAITHAQGADVIVQVRYVATNSVVLCETVLTNSTTVTLNFNTAPATNSLRVTIIG